MGSGVSLHRITSGWIAIWFDPESKSMKKQITKSELWKPSEMVMQNVMKNYKSDHAAAIANQAIDYARFRSRLCDGVKR